MKMKRRMVGALALVCATGWLCAAETAEIRVVPDRLTCVYAAGERAVLKVSAVGTNGVALTAGRLRVTCDNFGDRETMPPRDLREGKLVKCWNPDFAMKYLLAFSAVVGLSFALNAKTCAWLAKSRI